MHSSTSSQIHNVASTSNNHSFNVRNAQKDKQLNNMFKTQKNWLCLPKKPTASKCFMCFKLFAITFFSIMFVYELAINIICIKAYREKIQDLKDSEVWPPRSRIQYEATNAHFFLFTSLMTAAAIAVGILALMMENLIGLAGYAYAHGICTGFEVIGAWMSEDEEVQIRKALAIAPEPVMIIMALIFAHMVRKAEKELAKSPLWKKFMATKAGRGETMSDPNYKLGQDVESEDKNNNLNQVTVNVEKGFINRGLDLTNDPEFESKAKTLDSSNSSYSSCANSPIRENSRNQTPSSVTLLMDGRTRISVTTSDNQSAEPADLVGHEDNPQGIENARQTTQSQSKAPCIDESNTTREELSPSSLSQQVQEGDVQGKKEVESTEPNPLERNPSNPMTEMTEGASVVGYEEKSRNDSKNVLIDESSHESRNP